MKEDEGSPKFLPKCFRFFPFLWSLTVSMHVKSTHKRSEKRVEKFKHSLEERLTYEIFILGDPYFYVIVIHLSVNILNFMILWRLYRDFRHLARASSISSSSTLAGSRWNDGSIKSFKLTSCLAFYYVNSSERIRDNGWRRLRFPTKSIFVAIARYTATSELRTFARKGKVSIWFY